MDPYDITAKAIETNNLERLLLGDAPYAYRDHMSPAPGPTDLTVIYDAICEYARRHPRIDVKSKIEQLFPQLLKSVEGVDAASDIVFLESRRQADGRVNLGLDTGKLSDMLKQAVRNLRGSLINYEGRGGYGWPEGLLDDLRRRSENLVKLGGPAFVDI